MIAPATTAVRDPDFNQNLNSYVSNITSSVAKVGQTGILLASDYGKKGMELANGMMTDFKEMDNFQDGQGEWSEQTEGLLNEKLTAQDTDFDSFKDQPNPAQKQMDDFQDWGVPAPTKDTQQPATTTESKEWEDW